MKYTYSGRTDIGLERRENQDSFGIAESDWGSIFVVSDGFGHQDGGKFASKSTVDTLINNFTKIEPDNVEEFFKSSVDEINKYIYFKKVSKYENAMLGCTMVALLIKDNIAHIAHVGDSRAYIFRNSRLNQLTKDHSYIQSLIDRGEISPAKAIFHAKRHILNKALGSKQKMRPDCKSMEVNPNDIFILCSDGVWGFISQSKINEIIANNIPSEATLKMIKAVKNNLGADNITIQIISFK